MRADDVLCILVFIFYLLCIIICYNIPHGYTKHGNI